MINKNKGIKIFEKFCNKTLGGYNNKCGLDCIFEYSEDGMLIHRTPDRIYFSSNLYKKLKDAMLDCDDNNKDVDVFINNLLKNKKEFVEDNSITISGGYSFQYMFNEIILFFKN